MKKLKLGECYFGSVLVLSLICALSWLIACQTSSLNALEKNIDRLRQKVGRSVVCLAARDLKSGMTKFGSGIIIDRNHILTTENLLENVDSIRIMLQDGRTIQDSQIVAQYCDFETNISLLEVKFEGLRPLSKTSSAEVKGGAIGVALDNSQYSKELCAVLGLVNPSWICGDDIYDEELLIFNPVSSSLHSGTPVFSSKGELLGLVEGKLEGQEGVVLLLPAKTCKKVSQVLKEEGRVERGWIGIASDKSCKDNMLSLAMKQARNGILITQVVEGSPAWSCGLKPGDLIVSCDGETLSCKIKLRKTVSSKPIGSSVVLGILRQSRKMNVQIEVKPRPEIPAKRRCPNRVI